MRMREISMREAEVVKSIILKIYSKVCEMADSGEEISDTEQVSVPSPKIPRLGGGQGSSTRKFAGASVYKSSFQACWQKKWPCIKPVKNDQHCFQCTVCSKTLSCGHQGERDVTRHIASVQHKRNSKAVSSTPTLNFVTSSAKDKVLHIQ